MHASSEPSGTGDPLALWGARLALSPAEIAAIVRTGSIASECRSRRTRIFKLYYYEDGKRRTKYLGSNEQEVASLREILAARRERKVQRSNRRKSLALAANEVRERCRHVRRELLPVLEASGAYLHGARLRRRRTRRAN